MAAVDAATPGSSTQVGRGQIRAVTVLLVCAVHLLAFWAFAYRFAAPLQGLTPELKITLFDGAPNVARIEPVPIHPEFEAPEAVVVPEPDIRIDESDTAAIVAKPLLQKIPPQPDMASAHDLPTLPDQYRAWATTASLMLRLRILQDGSVGETTVVRSSGQADVDDFVCEFVRANWHYSPATVLGEPVQDWMTVVIRFAT